MKQASVVIVSCLLLWGVAYDAHAQRAVHDASNTEATAPRTRRTSAEQTADEVFTNQRAANHASDPQNKAVEKHRSAPKNPHESSGPSTTNDDQAGAEGDALAGFYEYEEALIHAENAFAFGDYETVIQTLGPWLYPQPRRDATAENTTYGYTWLAASAWFVEDLDDAEKYFTAGLRQHPTMQLDPMVFPPALINFFQAIRKEMDLLDPQDNEVSESSILYIESRVSEHPIWVSMLPFGYGMFVNNKPEWGAVYALTEGALLTVSAVTFWANYAKRLPSDDPNHPMGYADPERAKMRKRLHISTGAAFLGVVLINAIHGALIHKQTRQVQYRTLSSPPEGFDSTERSERSRQSERNQNRWNIHVGPFSNSPRAPLSNW